MATIDQPVAGRRFTRRPLIVSAWSALSLFTLIVATGAGVRLTGSGLGCSNWPNCSDQSLTPQDGHAYIEFGNRLITTPVALAAAACVVFAMLQQDRRRDYDLLGRGLLALVFAQALLGAVAVWTELNWISVSGHYLLSMVSLVLCVMLVFRLHWEGRQTAPIRDAKAVSSARIVAVFGAAVVTLGTLVTASGPYAGGQGTGDVVERFKAFGADTFSTMVMVHARVAAAFGILAVAAWLYARLRSATALMAPLTAVCLLVATAGIIGQLQYHVYDYPAALVWAHIIVATLLWNACVWLWLAARRSADV
jgi:cytochrome c oxidase assembly protein subunit 15